MNMESIKRNNNKVKVINGQYNVCDCEHYGDIERCVSYLSSIKGIKVTGQYWDKKDCGEAYVSFQINSDNFVSVYKKLCGDIVSFDTDINDYLKVCDSELSLSSLKYMSHSEFYKKYHRMENDITEGFEKRIPICLFFGDKCGYDKFNVVEFIKEVISRIGEGTEIICYNTDIVDGSNYYNFLITTDISNMISERFKSIGDYCLGNKDFSMIKRNGLYGECRCIHVLFGSYYDEFRNNVQKVINKENMVYKNYYRPDKELTFDEYYNKENGTIITSFEEKCNGTYRLKK